MKKKAAINAIVNAALLTEGATKGAKKFNQEIKNPSITSHDIILRNKPEGLPSEKVIGDPKIASESIDTLYFQKIAESKDDSIVPKGVAALLLAAATASAISNKNPLAPFRQTAKVMKEVPRIVTEKFLGKKRLGKIIMESLRKGKKGAEESIKKPKFVPPGKETPKSLSEKALSGAVLGGGIGLGNLAVHMIGDKYFENKNAVRRSFDSFPELGGAYHEVLKKGSKGAKNKKYASEIIDEVFEKKAGTFTSGKHFVKKLLKEDVAQNALGSLPFFAVPAAASYATGRDLKYDAKKVNKDGKDKIVIDIPLSDFKKKSTMNKTAGVGFKNIRQAVKGRKSVIGKMKEKAAQGASSASSKAEDIHKSPTWKHFFKYEMPSRSVRALTWALPATALTAATGRNVRGSFERTNQQDKKPLEAGKARITIETAPHRGGNEPDPKTAGEHVDALFKIAIDNKINDNNSSKVKKNERKV